MGIHMQIFLIFFFLYFSSSENSFCYATKGEFLSHFISLFGGNKYSYKYEGHRNSKNSENCTFNVLKYGAKGDGITNDTEAFISTWDAACKTEGGVMLVPSGFTFLLQPVNFDGSSCQPNIIVQVDGKIVAPNKLDWVTYDEQWILFKGAIKGLIIKGNGVIDGCGASWWESDDGSVFRAHAVRIINSSNVTVTGITIQNSPRMHIFISDGRNVNIYNFTVSSPGDSPNTDGIHISRVHDVDIHNTTIACGDDCVSIQSGCSNVKIYDVNCGPGHGYSIGGLGPNKQEAHVSNVAVLNSTVHDALSGVRIKTWPGGRGSVQNIVFSNITMSDVKIPIVIYQYYCNGGKNCPVTDMNAVAVSNITYTNIKGTYIKEPISLACNDFVPCRNLTLAFIEITPSSERGYKPPVEPYCLNAYGEVLTNTTPPLNDCLSSVIPPKAPAPTPPPPEAPAPAVPSSEAPVPIMPPKAPTPTPAPTRAPRDPAFVISHKAHDFWFGM